MNGHASRLESFGWGYAPIGTTGTVTLGKMLTPSQKAATDSKRPYLRAAHVQPGGRLDFSVPEKSMWFSESEVRKLDLVPNDIVIVEGGAVGRSAIIEKQLEGWGFQNSIVRIRPNPEVAHAPYIRYALQFGYDSKMIELECSTATLPHFTAEKVSPTSPRSVASPTTWTARLRRLTRWPGRSMGSWRDLRSGDRQ